MQTGESKGIEVAFIVLTPSKYGVARRDTPKIEKMKKIRIGYKNVNYIMKGI